MPALDQQLVVTEILDLLDETFENHHGIYLDRGTSLFETLAGIDADQASQPVGGRCATLAAQVAHVTYYLEVLERYLLTGKIGAVDWHTIWETVDAVTPEAWDSSRRTLEQTYRRIRDGLRSQEVWQVDPTLSGALAMVVHTAYHLGEIRQALCMLR